MASKKARKLSGQNSQLVLFDELRQHNQKQLFEQLSSQKLTELPTLTNALTLEERLRLARAH